MRYVFLFLLWTFPCFASIQSDVALWLQLRKDGGITRLVEVRSFLQRHPDWPQTALIRTNFEHTLVDSSPDDGTVLQWFDANAAQTDRGRFAYWQALRNTGRGREANAYLQKIWREGNLNREQQQRITISVLGASDHAARIDALLWQGNLDRADDALVYVSGLTKQIGKARSALQHFSTKAPSLVGTLPDAAYKNEGLLFDLVRFYRQKEQDAAAVRILSRVQKEVGAHAALWARERAILARRAFEKNDFRQAYRLASSHRFTGGAELADAEWLAGWIATTRLKEPEKGFHHFERMYKNVTSAISTSRAAYWAGVAASQLGQKQVADSWYALAAKHMHTFYGQMAAYALGNPKMSYAAFFKRAQAMPQQASVRSDLVNAATILYQAGRDEERDLFLQVALTQLKERKQPELLIPLARQLRSPEMALFAAKAAYENGVFIRDALFPRLDVPYQAGLEKALTLGIIRQESMFDRYAISSAGAIGLMQLLPSTASHTARQCAIPHNKAAQLFDPDHNMRLGQAYLLKLIERYDGFIPMAAAAYNAGPGNVDKWVAQMGDPRTDQAEWIDWVERIPFYETRNYVQRVWEAYSLYKVIP